MKSLSRFSLLLLLVVMPAGTVLADQAYLIEQMKSGNAVLMIRHALAPGFGDPEGFKLEDCSTQRNLDDVGRDQARSIGDWLRSRGIENARVYSSQWCRCLETARLMQLGPVTPLPALNSFFQRPQDREPNLAATKTFIQQNSKPGELIVMVTHQVTISGITGRWVDSGHGRLLRPGSNGEIELLGDLDFGY